MYTTIQEDTWDKICKSVYGSEMAMDKLIKANTSLIDIVIFPAGKKIETPEIEVVKGSDSLPPWKTTS